jgi:hypothetical protein
LPSRERIVTVNMVKRLGALAASAAVALTLATPANAAAPNYILVNGAGLPKPILLANWQENMQLLIAVANAPRARGNAVAGLTVRPRFDLAEFWHWGGRPRPTNPAQASQHGTFYPAHGSKAPLIVLTVQGITVPRIAPASVLEALHRHGVPVRR